MGSSEAMPRSITTSRSAGEADDVVHAVALLFRVFARAFGAKWRSTFEDPQAPVVWERKLRSMGFDASQIRAGIGPATNLEFPPSLGEFMALCRPSAPGLDAALREAMRWDPAHEFAWSHPAVGATAAEVGHWRMHTSDDRQLRQLFGGIYAQMLERARRGERLDIPVVRAALPPEIRTPIPAGAPTPPAVAAAIAEAARYLGISHA